MEDFLLGKRCLAVQFRDDGLKELWVLVSMDTGAGRNDKVWG